MFNIGFGELIVVFIIALIVLGPEKLPDFAKKISRIVIEIKKIISKIQSNEILYRISIKN